MSRALATEALSQRELDCLVAVESLSDSGWPARTKDIAKTLQVRAPSAVEIIHRLQEKHFLEKGPGGVKVSFPGHRVLGEVHRSHRIMESMLANIGVPPEVACRESKKIDRYVSREVTRAFCNYLGHPKACPDNMPIQADPKCCSNNKKGA